MTVSLIVAVAENGVIGQDGRLPWVLPDDLRHFKRVTMGHTLIMGRKTFDSIGRALPGRHTIVLSRDPSFTAVDVTSTRDLPTAIAAAASDDVFVIGGASVYREALLVADRLYVTRVHATVEGDVHFPPVDRAVWHLAERIEHPQDDQHAHAFTIERYVRRNAVPPSR